MKKRLPIRQINLLQALFKKSKPTEIGADLKSVRDDFSSRLMAKQFAEMGRFGQPLIIGGSKL